MRGGNGNPALRVTAHNGSGTALHNFMVQFNKNAMGLAPASQVRRSRRRPVKAGDSGRGRRRQLCGVLAALTCAVRRVSCEQEAAPKDRSQLSVAYMILCSSVYSSAVGLAVDAHSCIQMLGFEPIAPGASADAELATVQNQALHNPAAPPGTLQVCTQC